MTTGSCPLLRIANQDPHGSAYTPYACLESDCAWWTNRGPYSACAIVVLATATAYHAQLDRGKADRIR